MKITDADGSGFRDFLTKRNSKKSTVGIVETPDKLRKEEYLERFEGMIINQLKYKMKHDGQIRGFPIELYTCDLFNGIVRVEVEVQGTKSNLEDLKIDTKFTPVPVMGTTMAGPKTVQLFTSTLPKLAELLKREDTTTIAVISGIINDNQTLNVLEMFVNDVVINGNMFSTNSLVSIVVDDSSLLPKSVINNSFTIRPMPSTREERRKSLEEIVDYSKEKWKEKHGSSKTPTLLDKKANHFIAVTDGLNLNDFQSCLLESLIRNNHEKIKSTDVIQLKTEIVNSLKGVRIDNLDRAIGFDAVGGYQEIKDYLDRKVVKVYDNLDLAEEMNVKVPRGILYFGPPGTGKTYLNKQMSKALDCVFVEIMFEQLMSKWVGESEGNLNELLNRIDAMGDKVVVFIDELDSLGTRGGGGSDGGSRAFASMFSRMLKWLSDPDRKAIVVGATNVPEHLDPAFIREQRFDKIIYMGPPDFEARVQIFEIKFKATGVKIDPKINMEDLARRTQWYSGANIEGVVLEALTIAFERIVNTKAKDKMITVEDVEKAMSIKKKDSTEMQEMNAKYLKYAEKHCDDQSLIATVEEGSPAQGQTRKKNSRLGD